MTTLVNMGPNLLGQGIVQAEQNRLGGLLKLALRGTVDKGAARRALAEVERTSAQLRSLIGRLAERV